MGNLLGSPITEKDTHTGKTHDTNTDTNQSPDGGGLQYGISSMQGWRVHMEDAHICQPFLYAEKLAVDDNNDGSSSGAGDNKNASNNADNSSNNEETPSEKTAIEATLSTTTKKSDDNKTEVNVTEKTPPRSSTTNTEKKKYIQISLPNHSLFAVFDGHGGSFAAEYASRNMLRVLCRTPSFVEYAEKWQGRNDYLAGLRDKLSLDTKQQSTTKETPPKEGLNDKQRLQMLKKHGLESDEKVKQIKEQVRKHFDGEKLDVTNITTESANNTIAADAVVDSKMDNNADPTKMNTEYQYAQATYDHELMTLLEHALRDAFINIDKEILREVQGDRVQDSNFVYGKDYDISRHGLDGCVGHLPKEDSGSAVGLDSGANSTNTIAAQSSGGSEEKEESHPTPNDDEDAGTTVVVVMTTPKWIVCANAGDSRAVYSRSNHRAVPLSYDHKPEDEDEERRIREAGGYVSGGRVEGDLAVSRGLGDYRFKDLDAVMSGSKGESVRRDTSILQRQIANTLQVNEGGDKDVPMLRPSEQKVSPLPDIIVQNRDPKEDEFIIIACDGIWDVQTNQECVRMVADIFAEGESDMGLACEEILDLCLIKGSKDNMTAGIIKFPKQAVGSGGGVMARRERRGAIDADNDDRHDQALRRVYNPYLPPGARVIYSTSNEKDTPSERIKRHLTMEQAKHNMTIPKVKEKPTSFHLGEEVIGGFAAGVIGTLLGFPLDLVKTRMQTQSAARKRSPISILSHILRTEGLKSMYKGVGPPLLSLSIVNTLSFTSYSYFRQNHFHGQDGWDYKNALSGMAGAPLFGIVTTPENFLKTQMQLDNTRH